MSVEKYDKAMRPNQQADDGMTWRAAHEAPFRLAGFAWFEQDRVYRRLPVSPDWPLPAPVDNLANCTAGGQVQFRTDSRRLAVRVELAARANMNHMPATGQCGFDCYIGRPTAERYCNTTKYDHTQTAYESMLYELPDAATRQVTLNFPLYQGVKAVFVGLDPDAAVDEPEPYVDARPVVVYGTSITQGGCAARPGMAFTNILSRWLNRPFVNQGFSGNGRGEPEVARTLAQIPNPACHVLDYEANAAADGRLQKTLDGFIGILREAHPETPILVVSRIRPAGESFNDQALRDRLERRDFQQQVVEKRRAAGDSHIAFVDGGDLLGDRWDECTVDGSHPTDLGFLRMAEGLRPVLEELLA